MSSNYAEIHQQVTQVLIIVHLRVLEAAAYLAIQNRCSSFLHLYKWGPFLFFFFFFLYSVSSEDGPESFERETVDELNRKLLSSTWARTSAYTAFACICAWMNHWLVSFIDRHFLNDEWPRLNPLATASTLRGEERGRKRARDQEALRWEKSWLP